MQRIIVADTETTGFSPKTEEIVEIAFIEIDEDLNEVLRFEYSSQNKRAVYY